MRPDYSAAEAELVRRWELVRACPTRADPCTIDVELVIRMSDLAELYQSNALVRRAAEAVLRSREVDVDHAERNIVQRAWKRISTNLIQSDRLLDAIVHRARQSSAGPALSKATAPLREETIEWVGERVPWIEFLRRVGKGRAQSPRRVQDLEALVPLCHDLLEPVGTEVRRALADSEFRWPDDEYQEFYAHLTNGVLDRAIRQAKEVLELIRDDGNLDAHKLLCDLHRCRHRIGGSKGHFPLRDDDAVVKAARMRPHLDRFLSHIAARLRSGPLAHHALSRLKVWVEQFERAEIRTRMDEVLKKEEAVLQPAVDRFLFAEGFFPITHCEAATGSLDTFLSSGAGGKFREASRGHHVPLLLELKQTLDGSEADLQRKVREARDQAGLYADHVRAELGWRDAETVAVVAYDRAQRFYVPDDSVVLLYLGKTKPSENPKRLEL